MATINVNKIKQTGALSSNKSQEESGALQFLNKEITFGFSKFSNANKEQFYSEMKLLLNAGLDIHTSLLLVNEMYKKSKIGIQLERIASDVQNGKSLSEAMEICGVFSSYEIKSILIGEETGRLEIVLSDLANYFRDSNKQRRQVISALTYPVIICTTAVGVIMFMLRFVVPMFEGVFKRFHSDLPWITKLILKLSALLGKVFLPSVVILFLLAIWIYKNRRSTYYRKTSALFISKTPILGNLIKSLYLARFCQCMNLLLSSKIPLDRSLSMAKEMINYYPIELALDSIKEDVMRGTPFYAALKKFAFFESKFVSIVKVGEEVNELDLVFLSLSNKYQEESQHKIAILNNLLEPMLIIFLGVIVAVILVSMYLPLFKLSNSMPV
jgi:type IV pilus assembly protein PilC